jgi:hypothetical protein
VWVGRAAVTERAARGLRGVSTPTVAELKALRGPGESYRDCHHSDDEDHEIVISGSMVLFRIPLDSGNQAKAICGLLGCLLDIVGA